MKKSSIIILSVVGLVVIIGISMFFKATGTYDKAVGYQETTSQAWGNVEATYQRRMDLIPNLVSTVKGFAAQEKEVLIGVTEARASVGKVTIDASNLKPENIKAFEQAQSGLTQALSKLMLVQERYPELRSNQNFLQLQAQLEGTENRINVARQRYNDTVKEYNTFIRGFWRKMYLGWLAEEDEFTKKGSFESEKGAEKAYKVQF
ncbi:MAG: LemA family protein [Flavobacteriales bacterium]|nr:LemA family protein [Flavobacteriales bacterium]|tara:strand:- start:1346 stop:1960 length:615 start_codon:yes stop_codon:yes gene_type:complete